MWDKWSRRKCGERTLAAGRCLRVESLESRALLAVVSLNPVKDNTLYETDDGSLSNGAGQHFFAGNTGQPGARDARRGLLAFDVAGNVPAGATINSVTLTTHMSRTNGGPVDVAAHRVLADWGEGASAADRGEGGGAPAATGDATWLHTFFPSGTWTAPGGDFVPSSSATTTVDQIGFYTWQSTAALVADVQHWLDTPQANFGWLLAGDEAVSSTAKRFDSRENAVAANRPLLSIDFSLPVVVPDITIDDVTQAEGNTGPTDFVFAVRLSQTTTVPVSVEVTTSGVTATAGSDFLGLSPTTVTFAPGETEKTVSVSVTGDITVEADETFQVNLANAVGGTIIDPLGLGTIANDDTTELSIGDVMLNEGDDGFTSFIFDLTLSAPSDAAVTLLVSTEDGSATAGSDYVPLAAAALRFDPGQTEATVTVQVAGDTLAELDESFQVNLSDAVGATIADGSGVGTILNDDEVEIMIDDVALAEGNTGTTPFQFTVRLSTASDLPVSVIVATADGTATAGADYTPIEPISLQFAPGETTKTVVVSVLGDQLAEQDETFTVNLSDAVGARIVDGEGTGTIQDDEATRLFLDNVSRAEGDTGTTFFDFVLRLSNASQSPVTVTVNTADLTATADEDYRPLVDAIVQFAPGETEKTVAVEVIGDDVVEPNETFQVNLSNAVGATIANPSAVGTIENDDLVQVSIDDAAIAEGDAGTQLLAFIVRLARPSPSAVTLEFSTDDETAIAGVDYEALAGVPLMFAPGETEKTVTVPVTGDTVVEQDETFLVRITSVDGAVVADGEGIGTILNDDQASLVIEDVSQAEGDAGTTAFAFTVRLSAPSESPVTVEISTVGDSATSDVDFVASGPRQLVFAPGESLARQFTVQVNGDLVSEPDERFQVVLSNSVGAIIARATAIGTILDDDVRAASISGSVYGDTNNNGRRDSHERGIAGVAVTLTGADFQGTPVGMSVVTGASGTFVFANLAPGTYTLTQTQPARYLDGQDHHGTPDAGSLTGFVGNDRIAQIQLGSGVNISGIGFGERGLRPELINKSLFHSNAPARPPVGPVAAMTADTGDWVRSLYVDLLGRAATDNEAGWWNARMAAGASRDEIVAGFFASEEYRGRVIGGFYQEYLGRAADSEGRRFWLDAWTNTGDEQSVAAGILASPEYYRAHGTSDAGFVTSLYEHALGRDAVPSETQYWTELLAGSSRDAMARQFLSSEERLLDVIAAWHLEYLDREPSAAESGNALHRLAAGTSVEELRSNLLTGDEYDVQVIRPS